eukprot:1188449-Prorocentrum_minimum.AAC.6
MKFHDMLLCFRVNEIHQALNSSVLFGADNLDRIETHRFITAAGNVEQVRTNRFCLPPFCLPPSRFPPFLCLTPFRLPPFCLPSASLPSASLPPFRLPPSLPPPSPKLAPPCTRPTAECSSNTSTPLLLEQRSAPLHSQRSGARLRLPACL